MKNRPITVALLLTVALVAFLCMLSCATEQQNVTQNQNRTGNQANAATMAADPDDPCTETNINAKKQKLRDKVVGKIDRDTILKKQYHGFGEYPANHQNEPPRFELEVTDGQYGAVEIHFKGDVSGPGKLKTLIDFLDEYKKKGCLERVTFTPGPLKSSDGSVQAAAFVWNYCEWPTVACPGGRCAEPPCAKETPPLTPTPTPTPAS